MLASYKYKKNTYFTPLLNVTGKLPVWSDYAFPESTTVANTRLISALFVSVVIDTCVDLTFFLACFKCPCNVVTDLGEYFLSSFDVNNGHD